jgi:hypothetical protein
MVPETERKKMTLFGDLHRSRKDGLIGPERIKSCAILK